MPPKTPRFKVTSNGAGLVEFDVWGARGSRNLTPPTSRIANYTSCYSLKAGPDLFVIDGGRGLGVLSHAISSRRAFQDVQRIHLFLSHSHMDHWEGLKDAGWFWSNGNGLRLNIYAADEAIEAIQKGYGHPSYVPLEILAERTLRELRFITLQAGDTRRIRGWNVRTYPLNHYSGVGADKNHLATLGYRLRSPDGFTFAYLCDHEPTPDTTEVEQQMLEGAHLAIVDAHFRDREQHAFGHGSQEHAAALARDHAPTTVLAGHHGPTTSDAEIRRAHKRHGRGLKNFALATEGMKLSWDAKTGRLR
jgi:phosphoribosyl 1,2-cyclic phosphodiesterase